MPFEPENLPTGTVTGRYAFVSADTSDDVDVHPQMTAVVGAVIFRCTAQPPTVFTFGGEKVSAIVLEHKATFDDEGFLGAGGHRGIQLLANSPLLNPAKFQWTVTFQLREADTNRPVNLPGFSFEIEDGQTIDLADVTPVGATRGTIIQRGMSAYEVAVAHGYQGTEAEWLDSLYGEGGGGSLDLTIGTVTTGAAGSQAQAAITGAPPNKALNLTIPRGDPGTPGNAGPANSLAIGSVTTGAAGSNAAASITGAPPSQVLNLTLPRGADGAPGGGGGGGALPAWERRLSDFAGATDDDKLTAFMTYAAAQSHRGMTVVLDEARDYTFTKQQMLYSGFSIKGSNRPQDQARSSNPLSSRIQLQTAGGWFALEQSQTFGCSFEGLSMNASTPAHLIAGHSTRVLWTAMFRDISYQNGSGVLGSPNQKLLLTACAADGFWNVNNVRDVAFNIGGSDCKFNFTILLADAPPAFMANSKYWMRLDGFGKSVWQNIYMTCEQHSGMYFDAGTSIGRMQFHDCHIEGRNAGVPCYGALIRNEGAQLSFRDNWFAFAMTNPAATGRSDRGVIHQTSGYMIIDGATYRRANGVAESVPFVFASGGKVVIRNLYGDGFTGKPVVQQTSAGIIDADDSVTVVTAA